VNIGTLDGGCVPETSQLWISDVQHEIVIGSPGQSTSSPELKPELASGEYQIHFRHCA
jgi:hypothetical protein